MYLKPTRSLTALGIFLIATQGASAQDRQPLHDWSSRSTVSTRTIAQLSFKELDAAPDVMAHVFRFPGGGWGVSDGVVGGRGGRARQPGADADGAPATAREGDGSGGTVAVDQSR